MAKEIEKKYLILKDKLNLDGVGVNILQGYLCNEKNRNVRIRIFDNIKAFITVKSGKNGLTRSEFEYKIPVSDAKEMLALCDSNIIQKVRHKIRYKGKTWEIDVFKAENNGLIIAEIELKSEDETFALPPWVDREVTDNPRYFNSSLSINPFLKWK